MDALREFALFEEGHPEELHGRGTTHAARFEGWARILGMKVGTPDSIGAHAGASVTLPSPQSPDLTDALAALGGQIRSAFERLTPGLELTLAAAAQILATANAPVQTRSLEERVVSLERQTRTLRKDLSALQSSQSQVALLSTFAPEPYELVRPIPVSIAKSDDEYTAGFYDANIHAAGDTEAEAFGNLRSLILDVFDSLMAEPVEQLGPEPRRQRAVLESLIRRAGA